MCQLGLYLDQEALFTVTHALSDILFGLLQHTLDGAALEDGLKIAANLKYSDMDASIHLDTVIPLLKLLQVQFKMFYHLLSPSCFFLWTAHLQLHGLAVVIPLIPSIKQCHLMQPRKHDFSVVIPALWNNIPLSLG